MGVRPRLGDVEQTITVGVTGDEDRCPVIGEVCWSSSVIGEADNRQFRVARVLDKVGEAHRVASGDRDTRRRIGIIGVDELGEFAASVKTKVVAGIEVAQRCCSRCYWNAGGGGPVGVLPGDCGETGRFK